MNYGDILCFSLIGFALFLAWRIRVLNRQSILLLEEFQAQNSGFMKGD